MFHTTHEQSYVFTVLMYALCLEEYSNELHCTDDLDLKSVSQEKFHPRSKRSTEVIELEGIKLAISEKTETFLLIFSIMVNVLLVLLISNIVRK